MEFDVDKWDGVGCLPWLFAKAATGAVNIWCAWVENDEVCVRWGQKDGAMQDARFKCEPKNAGKKNATSGHEQAVKEAVAKWKKQLKKKYFLTEEAALGTRNLKPMLAKSFADAKKAEFPMDLQPKLDGVRCLANTRDGKVYLQSRGGDPYTVHHIQEQLFQKIPKGWILDGEIYTHGASLQTISSWVKKPQEESQQLEYHVYDMYSEDHPEATWAQRREMLSQWFTWAISQALMAFVFPVQTHRVDNQDHIRHYHDAYVAAGYEGAILRLDHGVYKFGYRSSELLKFKDFQDGEFPIAGFTNGKGKFTNVPIFTCLTGEGLQLEVTPKGTEAERNKMLAEAPGYIGKMLTVRYLGWTEDRKPRCAVGVAIREPGT